MGNAEWKDGVQIRNPQFAIRNEDAAASEKWTYTADIRLRKPNGKPNGKQNGKRNGGAPNPQSASREPIGQLVATKPDWKHRRASESDEELLQQLAAALGSWLFDRLSSPSS